MDLRKTDMNTNTSNFDAAGPFADGKIVPNTKLEAINVAVAEARREATTEFFARIGRSLRTLFELPRRRAVRSELSQLSDRELADIGLSRSDLPHLFEEGFVEGHAAERAEIHNARSVTA